MRKRALLILPGLALLAGLRLFTAETPVPVAHAPVKAEGSPSEQPSRFVSSSPANKANVPPANLPGTRHLARLISADRYCGSELQRFSSDEKIYNDPRRHQLLYRALLTMSDGDEPDPCTLALLARNQKDVLAYARKSSEPNCRLILGLQLTDQWLRNDGEPKLSSDQIKEGAAILRQLAYEHPENGYYAFGALGAVADDDRAGQEEFYLRLLRAESFTEPFLPQLTALRLLGHPNATAFLLVTQLFSARAIADWTHAYQRARDLAREGLYAEDFMVWAERNVENAKKIDQANLTEPWVNLMDQALIRGMTRIGGQKLGTHYPFYDQPNWIGFYKRRIFSSDITAIANPEAPCPEFLESVRKIQGELNASDDRQISMRF